VQEALGPARRAGIDYRAGGGAEPLTFLEDGMQRLPVDDGAAQSGKGARQIGL
jgi:hypothetical protein